MTMGLLFARILGLAAVLAMFGFAPSVAQAHAGHSHSMDIVAAADATAKASVAVVERTAKTAATQELTSAPAISLDPAGQTGCTGADCCSNGPCTACFGLLTPAPAATHPPALSSSLSAYDAPPRAGLPAEALRKPPRSSA